MSKRRKSKPKSIKSEYLDPLYEEVQNALRNIKPTKKGKKMTEYGQFGGGHHSTWNSPGSYGSTPECKHEGKIVVYEFGGKKLYGSSWVGLKEFSDEWNLVIDLASNVKPVYVPPAPTPFVKGLSTDKFKGLNKFLTEKEPDLTPIHMTAELLSLDWPDMNAPPAELDFWLNLWDMLPERTVIACQGGHGRTGTAIASLMIATGVDYYTALKDVREVHCKKAVETWSQEKYLHALYVDRLERYIAIIKEDPTRKNDVADYEKDLDYADKNPPKSSDDRGYSLLHGGSTALVTSNSSVMGYPQGSDIEGTRFKTYTILKSEAQATKLTFGQLPYVKACIDPKCNDTHCQRPDHEGWMPDFLELSAQGKLTEAEEEIIFNGEDSDKLTGMSWGV